MKTNITLNSVMTEHENNLNSLKETLTTIVKEQGGLVKLRDCLVEFKNNMKITTLKLDENDILLITYIDLDDIENNKYCYSSDEYTYDELYEVLCNLCGQLKI